MPAKPSSSKTASGTGKPRKADAEGASTAAPKASAPEKRKEVLSLIDDDKPKRRVPPPFPR